MSEIPKSSHCLNTNFPIVDNELVVGGLRINQLIERVTSTQFYAYDRQVLILLTEFKKRLPATRLTLELGRHIIGEAGVYICRVIDKKVSRGQTFLIVDGGMNHHLAASGNLGQVIRKNYPVAVANRMTSPAKEIVSIVGPLCTPLDLLADRVELPIAQINDLIVIFQSGAYGLTASPINFLNHPPPAEVFI